MPQGVAPQWSDAVLTLHLLATDPKGLGGIWVRARSGPVRDRFLALTQGAAPLLTKISHSASREELLGGLDLTATLHCGTAIYSGGLLARDGWKHLSMGERVPAGTAAILAQSMDDQTHPLIAIDEGIDDETLPPCLTDRMAFRVELEAVRFAETSSLWNQPDEAGSISVPAGTIEILANTAASFGIASIRAIHFALRASRAHAALNDRDQISEVDITAAARLVFAHRATQVPEQPAEPNPPCPPDPLQDDGGPKAGSDMIDLPHEILLDAVRAALPPDVLARLATQKTTGATATGNGSGDRKKGNRRGRPLPPGAGRLDGRNRLDVVATLRAAAPWQKIRQGLSSDKSKRLRIKPTDIRTKRFEDRSDRLLIFAVDASGSAALARLAEAKGAVELLLAEAYARRDHVSLLSFRGTGADLLLPPTRSLVQTKRRLASLAGGGGTPLAAGIRLGTEVADLAKGKGLTPTLALLTDGRANIALDGTANRAQASEDAQQMARRACASGIQSLVIDVSKRPERALQGLADCLNAPYIPLPRADATRLSQAISAGLDAR